MLKEVFVSLETAKLLKEKGFDVVTDFVYFESGDVFPNFFTRSGKVYYPRPTLALAMRWLREVHNYVINIGLDSYVKGCDPMGYYVYINRYNDPFEEHCPQMTADDKVFFKTYEEAAEIAVNYVLRTYIGYEDNNYI